ncbi:MAG: SRPBCC domain-containing protein [Acidimicrobiia bacterium]|nr:SRPBCC domain-containing protein [Acidimicrobiia bacterium]
MATVSEKVTIDADAARVFAAYTEKIGEWWPWRGVFTYTFAPDGVEPHDIRFETHEGGRFYEVWSDGTEHQIGVVKVWRPSTELVYSWEVAGWDAPSTVTVRFITDGAATTVVVEHSDLPDDDTATGYSIGQREILGVFAEYVEG